MIAKPLERGAWTERDEDGRVWLCWYSAASDPRESRSWLNRTLVGRPSS